MADRIDFDGENKLIIVKPGTNDLDVKTNLYSDWKEWVSETGNDNAKYLQAFVTVGGEPLTGTKKLDSTFFLLNGWKVRPQESNHRLQVAGNLFTDDGANPFVTTLGEFNVLVDLQTSEIVRFIDLDTFAASTANAVWEEPTSLHTTPDTFGEIAQNPPPATTNAELIADAVWEEPRIDHTSLGSFGEAIYIVRSNNALTGGISNIRLDVGASSSDDTYNGSLISIISGTGAGQSNKIIDYIGLSRIANVESPWVSVPDATSRYLIFPDAFEPSPTVPSASEISDTVWNENLIDHLIVGTTGEKLSQVGSVNNFAIADAVWNETLADHLINGSTGNTLAEIQANTTEASVNVELIALEVWDTQVAGRDQVNTFGNVVLGVSANTAEAAVNTFAIADQVWNETLADHLTIGSTGAKLNTLTNVNEAALVDAVWNETLSDHLFIGSTGNTLAEIHANTTEASVNAELIASEVWNTQTLNHITVGTFGNIAHQTSINTSFTIADIWNESLVGHTILGTAGQQLADLDNSSIIASDVWNELVANHDQINTFGNVVLGLSANTAEAAVNTVAIANQVWNTNVATSTDVDTFGKAVQEIDVNTTFITNQVWDEPMNAHLTIGSMGAKQANTFSGNEATIAGSVWDDPVFDHKIPGTFGNVVNETNMNTISIAGQIWDALVVDYNVPGTTGNVLQSGNVTAIVNAQAVASAMWDEDLINKHTLANSSGNLFITLNKLLKNKSVTDPITGVMSIYDDDDTNVLFTASMFEDHLSLQLYRGNGVQARNRFIG